jgi:nucleoside-diphosphate-sugar epimerase
MTVERVLVTGGSGFIGTHLCHRLITTGCSVRALVRRPENAAHLARDGVEVVVGDITDPESTRRATRNIDVVYHLAAVYRQEALPAHVYRDVNVTGTENMLKASAETGVQRFVHCSTVGVVGEPREVPSSEDAPYQLLNNAYQVTKVEAEKEAIRYVQDGRLAVAVARPSGVYGPGDMRFRKLFKAIRRGWFWMIGSGEVFYHPTYIDDVVDGLLLCGRRQEAIGRIYNIAGAEYVTVKELVALVAGVLGVRAPRRRVPVRPVHALAHACELIFKPLGIEPPLYRRRVEFFMLSRAFDIRRAQTELGFSPAVGLKTGLLNAAEWYGANHHL